MAGINNTTTKYPPDNIPTITERLVTSSSSPQLTPSIINDRNARRKFSFPATLHSNTLLGDNSNSNSSSPVSARRRLSNVSLVISDAVTRKLSTTIGWRGATVPTQEIVTQGKCLCGQYIRCRLKRAGLFTRKLGLQRIRSIIGTPSVHVVREVFPALLAVGFGNFLCADILNLHTFVVFQLGEELEALFPRLYTGVSRQVSRKPGGELTTPETALIIISAISRELFKTEITWGKIISLFAITGGLSVDCVKQVRTLF
jgi:Bcl-2 family protein